MQHTKKPVEITNFWKNAVIFTAVLAILSPLSSKADSLVGDSCVHATSRPLSHFLDVQGTLNDPPQFFPPVRDYVGWAGGNGINFALVDYAGLADKYIKAQTGNSIGTTVNGFVLECTLPNGRAQVTIKLLTTKALGFAQSIQDLADNSFDFLNTPVIFGAKAQDIINGAKPSVGVISFSTTFTLSSPGANLPDLTDVVFNPVVYAPVKISFKSTTFGKCSNGTKARLDVHQTGSTNDLKELVFKKEKVKIVDKNGGSCRD